MTQNNTQDLDTNNLPPIYFNRPPRIQPVIEEEEIEVPAPPKLPEVNSAEFNVLLRILPSLFMLVPTLAFMLLLSSNAGGQILIRLFAIGAMILSVLVGSYFTGRTSQDKNKQLIKSREQLAKKYSKEIDDLDKKLKGYQETHYSILRRLHKTPKELTDIFENPTLEGEQERLWERRPSDQDFLVVRVGAAKQRSGLHIDMRNVRNTPDELESSAPKDRDNQTSPAQTIIAEALEKALTFEDVYGWIKYAPLLVDLRKHATISVVGTAIEEDKKDKRTCGDVLRSLLLQIVIHHAPNNVLIYAVIDSASSTKLDRWTWLSWLPHCSLDLLGNFTGREAERVATTSGKIKQVLDQLYDTLKRRREEAEEGSLSVDTPHLVLLVDNWLIQEIREHPVFPLIFTSGSQLKVSALFHGASLQDVPDCSSVIIRLEMSAVDLWYGETGDNGLRIPNAGWDIRDTEVSSSSNTDLEFNQAKLWKNDPHWQKDSEWNTLPIAKGDFKPDQCEESYLENIAWLGKIQLMVSGGQAMLPSYVSFLDLHSVDDIPSLGIDARWKRMRTPQETDSKDRWLKLPLQVRVGLFDRHTPFTISLSQTADGPHGLLAGTTGSGKSEFLQTLICALAIDHDPRFLSFFLIDYKGGIAFKTFDGLPHVVGFISDLSPALAQRGLIALRSEVERRKRTFAEITATDTPVTDIASYHAAYARYLEECENGTGNSKKPMVAVPYLIIIVDEFAELKARFPDFINEVTSIARTGRALGIHLLMATQRPQGSVNEDIRSNTNYSIALRVQNPTDSTDMIGIRDAAYLPPIYGRGYFQSGGNPPRLFQGGYAGAPLDQGSRNRDVRGFVIRWTCGKDGAETEKEHLYSPQAKQKNTDTESQPQANGGRSARNIAEGIVQHIVALADLAEKSTSSALKLRQERVSLDPLPDEIPLEHLLYLQYEDSALHSSQQIPVEGRYKQESWKSRKWSDQDWRNDRSLEAIIGVSDSPVERKQPILTVDYQNAGESLIMYGSSGSGKSTAIMSLVVSLIQFADPNRLHIAVLDCGSISSLRRLATFPHVGTYLLPTQSAEIRSLISWVRNEYKRRRKQSTTANAPLFVLVIDNFAEFRQIVSIGADGRENPDAIEINTIEQIAQNGKKLGMYLILSGGERFADIPAGITRTIRNRLVFNLTNPDEARSILEPNLKSFPTQPGSANWRALPNPSVQVVVANAGNTSRSQEGLEKMAQDMEKAYKDMRKTTPPFRAEPLPDIISYQSFEKDYLHRALEQKAIVPTLGRLTAACAIRHDTLLPWIVQSGRSSPHIVVVGAPDSGKTTFIIGLLRSALVIWKNQQSQTTESFKVIIITDESDLQGENVSLERSLAGIADKRSAYSKTNFPTALTAINEEISARKNRSDDNAILIPLICVFEDVLKLSLKDTWATDSNELIDLVKLNIHIIVSVRMTTASLPSAANIPTFIRNNGGTVCITSPANQSSYPSQWFSDSNISASFKKMRSLDAFENRGRALILEDNQLEIVQIAHVEEGGAA